MMREVSVIGDDSFNLCSLAWEGVDAVYQVLGRSGVVDDGGSLLVHSTFRDSSRKYVRGVHEL